MRSNYPGVLGYVLLILGFGAAGVAIFAFGTSHTAVGIIVGAGAIVLFALSALILVSISRKEHHDPLEPVITEEGVERYVHRREEGDA